LVPILHVFLVAKGKVIVNEDIPQILEEKPHNDFKLPQESIAIDSDKDSRKFEARQNMVSGLYNFLFGNSASDLVNSYTARITNNSFEDSLNAISNLGGGLLGRATSLLRQGGGDSEWHLQSCDDQCAYWILGSMGALGLGRLALAPAVGFSRRQGTETSPTMAEVFVNTMSSALRSFQLDQQRRADHFWKTIAETQRRNEIEQAQNRRAVVSLFTNMRDRVRVAQRRNARRDQDNRARTMNFLQGLRNQLRVAQSRSEDESRDYLASIRNMFGFGSSERRSSQGLDEGSKPQTFFGGLLGSWLESNTPTNQQNVGGRRLDEGQEKHATEHGEDYEEFNENYVR